MLIVYMAHPVRGDVPGNLARARAWMRWIEEAHPTVAVLAPWILECEIWDDSNEEHRAAGMARNFAVIERCDELWLVGGRVSDGMAREGAHARQLGRAVRDLTGLGVVPPDARLGLGDLRAQGVFQFYARP